MSDAQDGKSDKARRRQALLLQPGEGGLWNPTDLQFMVDQGLSVPAGARFRAPTSARELASWGFAGGGAGPDPMTGLDDWLGKNNMSLQDFQTQYGGLPLVFNADGTATYDPAAQQQSFSYNNPDDGLFHKIAPLMLGGIATAGLGGFLPGTESVFGGAAGGAAAGAGGAMDMGVGLGGSLGAWGGITPIAEGVAAGVGAGAGTGALDGINWDLFNEVGSFTGDASAGWNVANTAAGAGTGALDGVNWDLFNEPGSLSGFDTSGGFAGTAGGSAAATQVAKTGLSKLLKDTLGLDVDSSTLDLIGKGLGLGLGAYGANQQADASKDLFNQYMGMGAPFRAELHALNANPSSFYNSDIFKGALQQGSDALSRSLSAKVGNPILNPTALQEMQNYTTRGSLDAYNNRWNQLASAGQLGVSQASNLGTLANQSTGNTYNAIGAGLQSVFGNQRDYTGEMLDLLKQRNSGSSGNTYNLPGWGP